MAYDSATGSCPHSYAHRSGENNKEDNNHVVQFYEQDQFLVETVGAYVVAGLEQGDAAVIIATSAHEKAFRARILQLDPNLESALGSGRLIFLNAEATLVKLLKDGLPDLEQFSAVVGGLIGDLNSRFGKVRAYGEMVDILRTRGNNEAMLRLEEYWNRLADSHAFTLLCAYSLRNFEGASASASFNRVCEAHSHVLPSETMTDLKDEASRNREIAALQQKAMALEVEVEVRKKTESALRKSEESLREAVRARDEFLSIAAHELRTPLTSLHLQTSMQKRRLLRGDARVFEKDAVSDFISNVDQQTFALSKLVDYVLDISRITQGTLELNPESLELGALVQDIVDRFSPQVRAAGTTLRITRESSITGTWDKLRIEQIVTNLLTNALKYGEGKPIEVSVLRQGDGLARIGVHDQGRGIAIEDRERVFERFERAVCSNHVSGLGLGLYICRQITEAHGGSIWVEHSGKAGSTFIVELPTRVETSRRGPTHRDRDRQSPALPLQSVHAPRFRSS